MTCILVSVHVLNDLATGINSLWDVGNNKLDILLLAQVMWFSSLPVQMNCRGNYIIFINDQ